MGTKLVELEKPGAYDLDASDGMQFVHSGVPISAYDESIQKYSALEGIAYFTAHSIVTLGGGYYLPSNLIASYFYTKSEALSKQIPIIRYAEDAGRSHLMDYMRDRIDFMRMCVIDGSILLIDGPLIAGDAYTTFMPYVSQLNAQNIAPVFIVKNSESMMVVGSFPELKGRFNSDLHWAHRLLRAGQRTALYRYVDLHNEKNSKIFTYVKSYVGSPLRIEFHTGTGSSFDIVRLLNIVHYLSLVQGDAADPQVRPVAIAEKFARECLRLVNIQGAMARAGLIPTVNQSRFGGLV